MNKNFKLIDEYVKSLLNDETTGHGYFHATRVMNNALKIAKNKVVNLEVIKVAALTHDLIDKKVSNNIEQSLEELKEKLKAANYHKELASIIEIIQDISYSKGLIPTTLEGRIVQDADRLDAIGAIGIAPTFAYGGKNNRMIYQPNNRDGTDSIAHFYDKLLKLKGLMNTPVGKEMAEERTKYMEAFLTRFYQEWENKEKVID